MAIGKVKTFNAAKGYGFIRDESGVEVFFHVSNVKGADLPCPGDMVSFAARSGPKGLAAVHVDITEKAASSPRRPQTEKPSLREASSATPGSRRPFFGKEVVRYERTPASSKLDGTLTGGAIGLVAGAMVGGPVLAGLFGAAAGALFVKDREETVEKVRVTQTCMRCAGEGLATSRVGNQTGFQCSTCAGFWKVPDRKMSAADLDALNKVDFTSRSLK